MIGILGTLGGLELVLIGAVISTLISGGTIAYQKHQTDKAVKKNDEWLAKQERQAKVMHLKDFNRAMQSINAGALIADKKLLDGEREKQAKLRNYGEPRVNS